jgi:hypothetical protein
MTRIEAIEEAVAALPDDDWPLVGPRQRRSPRGIEIRLLENYI